MTAVWPHGDPRDVARAVLADRRFRVASVPTHHRTLLDDIGDALRKLWDALLAPLRHAGENPTAARVVGLVVLAVVLGALAYVAVRFARDAVARRARRASRGYAAAALDDAPGAAELYARANEALAAGRFHEAAALLWGSALRALDERGRVRFDPARTPGEWRRAVRDPAFDAFARDAVAALFGDRGADAVLVGRMREAYRRVVGA